MIDPRTALRMTDDWFLRTSQGWKLRVFDALALVLLGAGGAAMLALDGAALGSIAIPLTFRWIAAVGAVLAWVVWAFRCPSGRERIGNWYLRHAKGAWFTEFHRIQRCPACGDSATPGGRSTSEVENAAASAEKSVDDRAERRGCDAFPRGGQRRSGR